MLKIYRELYAILTPRERLRSLVVLAIGLGIGLLDVVGIASILPFLAVLSRPEVLREEGLLRSVYETLGMESERGFLLLLGAAMFGVIMAGLCFRVFALYALERFGQMRGQALSIRLMSAYLRQPYVFFLSRNSSGLGATVLSEAETLTVTMLMPAMHLLNGVIIAVCISSLLVVVNPVVTLVVVVLFGGSYALIFLKTRHFQSRAGEQQYLMIRRRFQLSNDAFGGVKTIKVLALEHAYVRRFSEAAWRLAHYRSMSAVLGMAPRLVLEGIAIGAMLLFVLVLMMLGEGPIRPDEFADILPSVGVFAFAAARLFPALQTIYRSAGTIRSGRIVLSRIHEDLVRLQDTSLPPPAAPVEPTGLSRRLELRDVHYSYPGATRPALSGVSLAIEANTTVGIVGGTGAGKTTLVDIILGLLTPQRGALVADGVEIGAGTLRGWQASVGYVPQQIFLTDDSVAANIAFGTEPAHLDRERVERAARIARLHDFVTTELADGYDTLVGERGVRLSGGQIQRIGIARALYHDPAVLVLDEATSALDNITERGVMDAVGALASAKTIVMIAHRLSTVEACDRIFVMREGRVASAGSHAELVETCPLFRAMVAGVEPDELIREGATGA